MLAGAPGAVWFCPGLPPAVPAAETRVTFANTGTAPADLAITVLADKGKPSHRNLTVAASSVVTQRRTDLGPAGALTIETFGGPVLVEEGVDGRERHRHVGVRDLDGDVVALRGGHHRRAACSSGS